MTISRQNLSIVVVTFKSENVIHDCIKSIPGDIDILIVDNSSDNNFKANIEKTYQNVQCILAPSNLGMGSANNLGLKKIKTDFAFIINPDVTLEKNTIDEIINSMNEIGSFGIIAPISSNEKYPNYQSNPNQNLFKEKIIPFKVKSVDGYAMVLNIKRLNQFKEFNNYKYFDENFFMYLENDDLCMRIKKINEEIYIVPKSKINHLGGGAADIKYEYQIEMSRNWHWIWSKFYFNKKHHNFFTALTKGLPSFLSAIIKFLLYSFINKRKKDIYRHRILGFVNALIGKSSHFRPKIND